MAIRERRTGHTQARAQQDSGVAKATLSRLERGTHEPSLDTAIALARWLGWTVEQVIEAARTPAEAP